MYQISQSVFDLNQQYQKLLDRNLPIKIRQIFGLPALKYCQLSFGTISDNEYNPIEHFVIKNTIYFDQLEIVLSYLPQLRKLSINKRMELSPIVFNHITHVSLDFHHIYFDQFEILIKNYFHHIQV
jgi:hypothetical protein